MDLENIDEKNEKLRQEFYARPDAAQLEREINMQYGAKPVRPKDLNGVSGNPSLSEKERQWDSAIANWKAEQAETANTDTSQTQSDTQPSTGADGPLGPVTEEETAVTALLRSQMGDEGFQQFEQAGARGLQKLFRDDTAAAMRVIRDSGVCQLPRCPAGLPQTGCNVCLLYRLAKEQYPQSQVEPGGPWGPDRSPQSRHNEKRRWPNRDA